MEKEKRTPQQLAQIVKIISPLLHQILIETRKEWYSKGFKIGKKLGN